MKKKNLFGAMRKRPTLQDMDIEQEEAFGLQHSDEGEDKFNEDPEEMTNDEFEEQMGPIAKGAKPSLLYGDNPHKIHIMINMAKAKRR